MIIGLHGHKRVGKDTVYEIIQSSYPHAIRLAFADKIKESLAALFGVSMREIDTLKEEGGMFKVESQSFKHSYSWRTFAQRYGTEAHRELFGDDFWVDMTLPLDMQHLWLSELVVVTDVRFKNEARRILDLGGHIIHLARTELDKNDIHISEEPLPNEYISYIIHNNSSLEDLKDKALKVVSQLVK